MGRLQIPIHFVHQLIDGLAAMVARDVCMHVLPQPLDVVLLRAERRKKVQHESLTIALECLARLTTVVDAVVVQNEVNSPAPSVSARQLSVAN